MPIALDDEATWPSTVLRLLDASVARLPTAEAEVVTEIDNLIREDEIFGYHCTRLARDEIELIKMEGLCPLTPELRNSRVERRVGAGDFSREIADRFLDFGLSGDGRHRLGYSCFYFTKALGDWCWKFFRYWGGESIYGSHMNADSEERRALRSTGIPCIIELAVPIVATKGQAIARGFLYEYSRRRGIKIQESGYDTAAISLQVLRVIEYDSPDFQDLTRNISWPWPIHP